MFKKVVNQDVIYGNLVNGQWINEENRDLITIKSPIGGEIVGKVQALGEEDVDKIVDFALEAQRQWGNVPINERTDILDKAADFLEENKEQLTEIIIKEIGKDRNSALAEVQRTADLIRFTGDAAKNLNGETISGEVFPGAGKDKMAMVSREPIGVVLAISPFNYPVNLAASKIAPAIVGGNSVIFKPSTQGSISGLYLAKIFNDAGLPKGVLNTLTGRGADIGDYVVSHDDISFINFTGSSDIGIRISKLAGMKPVILELGGKDAAIVLEDGDLDLAAKNIVLGAFTYSGQRCTAIKRVIVQESVANELVVKIKALVEKLKIGNPLEEQVDIVPLIDEEAADFVESLIEEAIDQGGKLIIGGKRVKNLIYPTIIDYTPLKSRLAWEEPFGPVLPIIRVGSMDSAINIANESEYGLQSSVFTQDIDKAFHVANSLQVGTVQINNKTERGPDNFPFLGVKYSGMGVQGIKYSIEAMTRIKVTVINS